jgi:hypothetical protein
MDCITECPECKKSIFITKDGILKKREEKKFFIMRNNVQNANNNTNGQLLIWNRNNTQCPICKNRVLSLTQYCNICGYKFNKNNVKINKTNEQMLMEAKTINKILQLFETKIKIIEPKNSGISICEKEIPLHRIKSIQFHESTLLYIGSIKFTIEKELNEKTSRSNIDIISWPTKSFNCQFTLMNEAILRQKSLISEKI